MKLTKEQEEIINSDKLSFKINAVAGSGKTTTLLEYAKKNSHLKILYLAYNKSLQVALQDKLKQYNPDIAVILEEVKEDHLAQVKAAVEKRFV